MPKNAQNMRYACMIQISMYKCVLCTYATRKGYSTISGKNLIPRARVHVCARVRVYACGQSRIWPRTV